MATSPNYAWAEPDNSSLVKNGASDIRTLGDAIDTSVWNVGFGQAGKNKIINGDFFVNQRNFSSASNGTEYVADRFKYNGGSSTWTGSINTFTPGAAPVAGYEGKNYLRMVTSGQSGAAAYAAFTTRVEDVRTFAGQTTTISFWAKASSGTPFVAVDFLQLFGTGGSSAVVGTGQKTAITTSWARYSFTFAIPSVSGKTISTSNDSSVQIEIFTSAGTDYNTRAASMGIQSATIDIWGVQWEYGSKATPFQTATGNPALELAACQRYYYRFKSDTANIYVGNGIAFSTTVAYVGIQFPVTMRTRPTALEQTGTAANYATVRANSSVDNCTAVPVYASTTNNQMGWVNLTSANLVSGNTTSIYTQTADAYLGWSAEL